MPCTCRDGRRVVGGSNNGCATLTVMCVPRQRLHVQCSALPYMCKAVLQKCLEVALQVLCAIYSLQMLQKWLGVLHMFPLCVHCKCCRHGLELCMCFALHVHCKSCRNSLGFCTFFALYVQCKRCRNGLGWSMSGGSSIWTAPLESPSSPLWSSSCWRHTCPSYWTRAFTPSWPRRGDFSAHLTSPHLTSPHLTSPHLTSPPKTQPTPIPQPEAR